MSVPITFKCALSNIYVRPIYIQTCMALLQNVQGADLVVLVHIWFWIDTEKITKSNVAPLGHSARDFLEFLTCFPIF